MKRLLGVVWVLLLAGCVGLPGRTVETLAFVSPVGAQSSGLRYRVFIPLWVQAANKLGLGGCVGSCEVLGCSWCYSWVPDPGAWAGVDHERVAMVWGRDDVGRALGGSSGWLLGFNEPDLAGQANLTPGEAAVLWRQVEEVYPGRRLVAPAPSHLHPEWVEEFRVAYMDRYGRAPRLDALAFHCYWTSAECIAIGERFVAWAEAWGIPEVWCTEFAFVPAWAPGGDAEGEARRFVAWLEGEPRVTRYAPFVSYVRGGESYWPDTRPEANPSVLTASGELTVIGGWYARPTPEW